MYSAVARTPGATAAPPPPPPQHSQQLLAAHSNNVIRQTSLLLQFSSTRSLMIGGISLGVLATAIGVAALVTILWLGLGLASVARPFFLFSETKDQVVGLPTFVI